MYSTYDDSAALAAIGAGMGVYFIIMAIVCVLLIVAQWKIFVKAGEPGWACLVPFYNMYVLFKIAFGNGWLFLLNLIPFVGPIMLIVLSFKLSSAFGRGVGFGFGLWLLAPIFYLILAFGSAEYVGA